MRRVLRTKLVQGTWVYVPGGLFNGRHKFAEPSALPVIFAFIFPAKCSIYTISPLHIPRLPYQTVMLSRFRDSFSFLILLLHAHAHGYGIIYYKTKGSAARESPAVLLAQWAFNQPFKSLYLSSRGSKLIFQRFYVYRGIHVCSCVCVFNSFCQYLQCVCVHRCVRRHCV